MKIESYFTYEEIDNWIEQYESNNKEIASVERIGHSNEGRAIKAVHVTNNSLPIYDKEIVLIIIGRHGEELGTRVIGPAVLEWLASKAAQETRDRQHIIVVPVANPDGCVHNVFGLPVYHLSDLEKRTLLPLGEKYVPDIVMDVHSVGKEKFGLNWGGLEAVIIDQNAKAGEDQYILGELAREMIHGAARAGYPFLLHTLEYYQQLRKKADGLSESVFNNHVNGALYKAFHPLTFGMEVNHFVLSPHDTAQSGLVVITSMLDKGNRISPWEYYSGYPNRILSGDFLAWIGPRGRSAQERRNSRKEIWQKRNFFEAPFSPYRVMLDDHCVRVIVRYSGDEGIMNGFTMSFRIRGTPGIKSITMNNEKVDYYMKSDECSTYVFLDVETIEKNDVREMVAQI